MCEREPSFLRLRVSGGMSSCHPMEPVLESREREREREREGGREGGEGEGESTKTNHFPTKIPKIPRSFTNNHSMRCAFSQVCKL